ncbi:hypothetical protein HCH_03004 [Hahella chejuensis KCTC 2396]|uniref:NADP-dependent oxidoreductase domain-containing protein n=1 Tax=Hahella chejuensis (strain KCTC 2396) TaxID=349521 RepID=Q2SHV2_HAHCH|nr:aldo/keto reductase [Hahella chejuensis]ABC29772.1 hypothetical protein HCH_03004 [Hahella chejuensis KCTC 2396]
MDRLQGHTAGNFSIQQTMANQAAHPVGGNQPSRPEPRQGQIGGENNVIFGLNGKNENHIASAISAGYRTLDAGDTYGNTLEHLASAMAKSDIPREEFNIIYKVVGTETSKLGEHLSEVSNKLGGYIDQALVHNPEQLSHNDLNAYMNTLSSLKNDGKIHNVGMGEPRVGHPEDFHAKDSFEINAQSLIGPNAGALIDRLEAEGKPVFVYNVASAAKELMGDDFQSIHVCALITHIKQGISAAEPILSSSDDQRIKDNFGLANEELLYTADNPLAALETKISELNNVEATPFTSISGELATKLAQLSAQHDWDKEIFSSPGEYASAKNEALTAFTDDQLGTRVALGAKSHTVEELVNMLFESSGNCKRVEASNFINDGGFQRMMNTGST